MTPFAPSGGPIGGERPGGGETRVASGLRMAIALEAFLLMPVVLEVVVMVADLMEVAAVAE